MEEEQLFDFLKKRQGLLDGVAITGGEPCLHRDLPEMLKKIRAMGYAVKLDTNGNHPELLQRILEEKLADYIAMDIKNSPAKYALTIGRSEFDLSRIRQSVSMLMKGDTDYEFRTTVVSEFHEDSDFEEIGRMIAGARRYFLQCFTDRESVPYGNLHAPSPQDLERYAGIVRSYVPDTSLRGVG
jgi:pyruvate formate lyase activating enzyme